jgi:hypothetical protein
MASQWEDVGRAATELLDLLRPWERLTPEQRSAASRLTLALATADPEPHPALGAAPREGEGGPGREERYWLKGKVGAAIRHLRDVEDFYRVTRGGLPGSRNEILADRARAIHEQLTADILNGKTTEPTVLERARLERDGAVMALGKAILAPPGSDLAGLLAQVRRDLGVVPPAE